MLITQLGKTRQRLLAAIAPLATEDLKRIPAGGTRTVARILLHLAETERSIAEAILGARSAISAVVPAHDLVRLRAAIPALALETSVAPEDEPDASALSKNDLIHALEESRFRYLQRVFNETHEATLTQKSTVHPFFGPISLKSLVDFIWLHEQYHTEQIEGMERTGGAI